MPDTISFKASDDGRYCPVVFLNDCEAVNFGQKSLMEGTFENLLADRRRKQREKLSPHGFHALFGAGVLRSSTGTGQNKGGETAKDGNVGNVGAFFVRLCISDAAFSVRVWRGAGFQFVEIGSSVLERFGCFFVFLVLFKKFFGPI